MNDATPYPGLRPFEQQDAHLFFGREDIVAALLNRLVAKRFVAVTGLSGCGKSSIVRAGVLEELDAGTLGHVAPVWERVVFRPGRDPLTELAAAIHGSFADAKGIELHQVLAMLAMGAEGLRQILARAYPDATPGSHAILIIADQFEEVFRFSEKFNRERWVRRRDDAERFIELLIESSAPPKSGPSVFVMLTMRIDFLGDCSQFEGLPAKINDGQFLIPRLTREQAEAAIMRPAEVMGGRVAPALAARMLNDMATEQIRPGAQTWTNPDHLPLMQHVLARMWDVAKKRPDAPAALALTLDDYVSLGGLSEALSKHLDVIFEGLRPPLRPVAEDLFKGLVKPSLGEEGRDVRNPVSFDHARELTGASDADLQEVVDAFKAGNFLIEGPRPPGAPGERLIDISHESLIRQWKRLQDWVRQEERDAKTLIALERASGMAKGDEGLASGQELSNFAELVQRRGNAIAGMLRRYASKPDGKKEDLSLQDRVEKCLKFFKKSKEAQELQQKRELLELRNKYRRRVILASIAGIVMTAWAVSLSLSWIMAVRIEQEKFSFAQPLLVERMNEANPALSALVLTKRAAMQTTGKGFEYLEAGLKWAVSRLQTGGWQPISGISSDFEATAMAYGGAAVVLTEFGGLYKVPHVAQSAPNAVRVAQLSLPGEDSTDLSGSEFLTELLISPDRKLESYAAGAKDAAPPHVLAILKKGSWFRLFDLVDSKANRRDASPRYVLQLFCSFDLKALEELQAGKFSDFEGYDIARDGRTLVLLNDAGAVAKVAIVGRGSESGRKAQGGGADIAACDTRNEIIANETGIKLVRVTADGSVLYQSSGNSITRVNAGLAAPVKYEGFGQRADKTAFSPDLKKFLVLGASGMTVFDYATGKMVSSNRVASPMLAKFNWAGDKIFVDYRHTSLVFGADDVQTAAAAALRSADTTQIAANPDGGWLLFGRNDGQQGVSVLPVPEDWAVEQTAARRERAPAADAPAEMGRGVARLLDQDTVAWLMPGAGPRIWSPGGPAREIGLHTHHPRPAGGGGMRVTLQGDTWTVYAANGGKRGSGPIVEQKPAAGAPSAHVRDVTAAAPHLTYDGKYLLLNGPVAEIGVYDVAAGRKTGAIAPPEGDKDATLFRLFPSPASNHVLVVRYNGRAQLVEIKPDGSVHVIRTFASAGFTYRQGSPFGPDGTWFFIKDAGEDKPELIRTADGQTLASPRLPGALKGTDIEISVVSPNGDWIGAEMRKAQPVIWDRTGQRILRDFNVGVSVYQRLAAMAGGNGIAVAGKSGAAVFDAGDLAKDTPLWTAKMNMDDLEALTFGATGDELIAASESQVKILRKDAPPQNLTHPCGEIMWAQSASGGMDVEIFCAQPDLAYVLDRTSGVRSAGAWVFQMGFAPRLKGETPIAGGPARKLQALDARRVASQGTDDGKFIVWDRATREKLGESRRFSAEAEADAAYATGALVIRDKGQLFVMAEPGWRVQDLPMPEKGLVVDHFSLSPDASRLAITAKWPKTIGEGVQTMAPGLRVYAFDRTQAGARAALIDAVEFSDGREQSAEQLEFDATGQRLLIRSGKDIAVYELTPKLREAGVMTFSGAEPSGFDLYPDGNIGVVFQDQSRLRVMNPATRLPVAERWYAERPVRSILHGSPGEPASKLAILTGNGWLLSDDLGAVAYAGDGASLRAEAVRRACSRRGPLTPDELMRYLDIAEPQTDACPGATNPDIAKENQNR
jgi:hypothetical protein